MVKKFASIFVTGKVRIDPLMLKRHNLKLLSGSSIILPVKNVEIQNYFKNYLKESCGLYSD